ncbi:hypothetical protein MN032_10850 [Agromyces atrinae]|uniref:hypothetical protein n=1 Tax=Agromyces atrinae TaxID=592376 RepID=UPI001F58A14C|nr:hypothetical protein [Agromyces atrinae]MCI2958195.1 hypothetical protein [Agromyces atrinae]
MSKTFSVTNYKGVRGTIELSPEGSLVVIAGPNGAGKSSFIDGIAELFDAKGIKLIPKPIHDGEDEARAEFIDTELDLRIVRTWKKNDAGKLEVFALDGAKYGKPAEVVATLTGGLIFDPIAFLNMDEKKQRDELLKKVELSIDLDAVAREKAGAESRRVDAGRETKRLEGAIASIPKPVAELPETELSAADILHQIEEVRAYNSLIVKTGESLADAEQTVERAEARVVELRELLDAAERYAIDARETVVDVRAKFEKLGGEHDVESLMTDLSTIEETNAAIRSAQSRREHEAELTAAMQKHAAAQQQMDEIDQRKRAALAEAVFPVAGLSVDDDGITYEGIPFVQVNAAARRAVAFGIATAGDPSLRLVIIKDGDLLDATSLAMIQQLAEQRGYTVLVERDRDESRQIGFTIEDGALAGGAQSAA